MIKLKKLIAISLILLVVVIICIFSAKNNAFLPTNANIISPPQIVLDAGHGGLTNTIKV